MSNSINLLASADINSLGHLPNTHVLKPVPGVITSHKSPHRLTNRWEASLWLKGRQLYLGGFDSELDAAHAYDLVALACKVSQPFVTRRCSGKGASFDG